MADSPSISVLIPMHDERGELLEHGRTWTHGQTLDRSRFELIVADPERDPEGAREVSALVAGVGRVVSAPGASVLELWNAAAEAASADWLLITEAHCEAAPDCLEQCLEVIGGNATDVAYMLEHDHITHSAAGRLSARWFDTVYDAWARPDEWQRLNPVGFLVKRSIFFERGGFVDRYGMCAPKVMAAQLLDRGERIGLIEDAVIFHVHEDKIREHHRFAEGYAYGESEAREDHDRPFMNRYFGHGEVWTNRLRYRREVAQPLLRTLALATARALAKRSADAGWLARDAAGLAPAAVGGVRLHERAQTLRFTIREALADKLPERMPLRFRSYLKAVDDVVRLGELRWALDRSHRAPAPPAAPGDWQADEIDEEVMVGSLGVEGSDRGYLRWTKPTALFRVAPPAGDHRLVLDTDGLRGPPASYVRAVYVGGKRVPRERLGFDARRLIVPLGADSRARLAGRGVVVLSRPARPDENTPPDPRRRGMPLRRIAIESTR